MSAAAVALPGTGFNRRERRRAKKDGRIPLLKPGTYTAREILEVVEGKLRELGLTAMAGLSNAVENKVLDDLTGKTTYTITSPTYLALLTTAAGEGDTAGSLVEANYTGYARKAIAAADMSAASAGATANTVAQTFATCTAGSSIIIGWGLCSSASGAGDLIFFGTCSSTTISTTQTPPTIAISALSLTAD